MYEDKIIKYIHFELTNRCNAGCPQCRRTGSFPGNLSEEIYNSGFHDISINDVKMIFDDPSMKHVEVVNLCGNFGDPIAAPDIEEIIEYLHSKGIRRISISTNGGIQSTRFWSKIASMAHVRFHIDGDENTNHLYRIGVRWEKLMNNVKAFIDAGGSADWELIPFKHNESAISKCEELSKELGFDKFKIKRAYRKPTGVSDSLAKRIPIKQIDDNHTNVDYPTNSELLHPSVLNWKEKDIVCLSDLGKEIYIGANGDVSPCCWIGHHFWVNRFISKDKHTSKDKEIQKFITDGLDNINIHKETMTDIISYYHDKSDYFDLLWEYRKIQVCNKACGSNYKSDRKIIR